MICCWTQNWRHARDYHWIFDKCCVCCHEEVVVTQKNNENRFVGFIHAAITGCLMMKFESGYTVETVFDESKLGIEPYTIEALPNGELLILDSANSNIYRMSSSLSLCAISVSL